MTTRWVKDAIQISPWHPKAEFREADRKRGASLHIAIAVTAGIDSSAPFDFFLVMESMACTLLN